VSGWLLVPVVWLLFAMAVTPIGIGKPREPLTGRTASAILIAQGLIVACILKGGGVL
jgi:hypothetical protein